MGMLAYNTKHRLSAHQVCNPPPLKQLPTAHAQHLQPACMHTLWLAHFGGVQRWACGKIQQSCSSTSHGRRLQVLKHDWVTTQGGAAPRLLSDGVAHGAANVAALRRLRNLAHGDP
jgi:hypothetical protein